MKRRAIIVISVLAVLVMGTVLLLADRFRPLVLSPSELRPRRLSLPPPPDNTCDQAQRILAPSVPENPVRETAPLSADEVAIYQAVLQRWNSDSRGPLNVSSRTFPLGSGRTNCECFKAIEVQSLERPAHSFHLLTRDLLPGKVARLVDPKRQLALVETNDPDHRIRGSSVHAAVERAFATGLFELSEIAFDNSRRRALVAYSFVCGSLCGGGGVWLFEQVDGGWKKSERICGGWIS
jgi:hypothetical protein